MAKAGGGVEFNYRHEKMEYTRHIDWTNDVVYNDVENIMGDVLHACLSDSLVFETPCQTITHFSDGKDIHDYDKEVTRREKVTCALRVYYRGTIVYVSAATDPQQRGRPTSFFTRMEIVDAIKATFANATEIYEGRITKYDIQEGGTHNLFELLTRWACLDDVRERFGVRILRARCLLFSKVGLINGYESRMEIFEEKYADIIILIHGVQSSAIHYHITTDSIAELLSFADIQEEKPKLENMDTPYVATYYADRLQLLPPRQWQAFLQDGELLPKTIVRPIRAKVRLRGGPGRLAGRKYVVFNGLKLIISLYELQNDTDAHSLRICIYETIHSQTAEYRLSPMERLALFTDETKTIYDQILARLRIVYCNTRENTRTLISLDDKFVPRIPQFWVDGSEEYDICTGREFDSAAPAASPSPLPSPNRPVQQPPFFSAGPDQPTVDADSTNVDTQTLPTEGGGGEEREGKGGEEVGNSAMGGSDAEKMSAEQVVEEEDEFAKYNSATHKGRRREHWAWCLYFNRTVVETTKGNLQVSVGLSLPNKGFSVFCLDVRSCREAYRFISYKEATELYANRSENSLYDDLRYLEETILFDLLDDLIQMTTVNTDEHGRPSLVFASEIPGNQPAVVALLRDHVFDEADTPAVRMARIRMVNPSTKVQISILSAHGLATIGLVGMR